MGFKLFRFGAWKGGGCDDKGRVPISAWSLCATAGVPCASSRLLALVVVA